ncbi:DUF5700 domain-containing putative Zn-dependent protease [Spirochaeta cellobiosiphila]|uniref:DUF5700 domain-containing putative Zn-dependent protease n=1 Tax=Spirochaeta cellobiosiphila TaxID=504483 RepID=UPI0004255498|nr:DUF5700 domain-containing putative Zn-dependent protease [Spirochaeta cellobiosiphila]
MKVRTIVVLLFALGLSSSLNAQKVDFSSVDEFFIIASEMMEGKEISPQQWAIFDSTGGYKEYAYRPDQVRIGIIRTSLQLSFEENKNLALKDRILNITEDEMKRDDDHQWLKKHTLINFMEMKDNLSQIQSFRENYDFDNMITKAKSKLSSFLGVSIDSSLEFKPLYFLCQEDDAQVRGNGIYMDFNSFYKYTEEERINYLAHEFFHNYRGYYENNDFNHKNALNYYTDMIQNEGIADLIDKENGYKKYFLSTGRTQEEAQYWEDMYNNAANDLIKLQELILEYSQKGIPEDTFVNKIEEIVKYNGHPIGFYMANQIVKGGYKKEMLENFYRPYEFYKLYNQVTIENGEPALTEEYLNYIKKISEEYYH